MKFKILTMSAIVAAALIGCGGGGGDSSSSSTSSSSVSGTAVDEIIQNGIVELHADSPSGRVLATTTTDKNGNYSATINYQGVVVTSINCGANSTFLLDNGTTQKCDLTAPLMSASTVAAGSSASINVSPMTTQLVALATKGNNNATLTPTTINEAKTVMVYMYGVDPVVADPINDTTYKKQITVLHTVAKNNNMTMDALIQDLSKDASDGIIGDDNPTIMNSIKTEFKNNGLNSKFVDSNTNTIDANKIAQEYKNLAPIATAQATFTTIRNQINSISNEDQTGSLDKEVKEIQTSLDKNTFDNIGHNVEIIGDLLDIVTNEAKDTSGDLSIDGKTVHYTLDTDDNKTWNYELSMDDASDTFRGKIVSNIDTRVEYKPSTLPNKITATIDGQIPAKDNSLVNVKADVVLTHDDANLELNVNNLYLGTDSDNISVKNVNLTASWYKYLDDEGEEDAGLHWFKLNSITLDTTLDNRFNFDGTIKLSYVQNKVYNKYYGNNLDVNLVRWVGVGAECQADDGSYLGHPVGGDKSPTFTITTVDGNKTYSFDKNFGDGYYGFSPDDNNQIIALTTDFDESKNFAVSLKDSDLKCNDGTLVLDWKRVEYVNEFANSGYIPNSITFNGTIKDTKTNVELDGSLSASAQDFADFNFESNEGYQPVGTVSINGVLKRPEYPDTFLNATYKSLNKDGSESINVSYKEGDSALITMQANYDKTKTKLNGGTVTFTAINGFKLSFKVDKNGDVIYGVPVYVNSDKVGTLEERDGAPVIKYTDGTFESLN